MGRSSRAALLAPTVTGDRPGRELTVALVGDYPIAEDTIGGGVESAFLYLVAGLRQIEGLRIHVITLDRRSRSPRKLEQPDGVVIHVLPMFPRFELARNFRTYRARLGALLAQIAPDVVHAQGATDHAYVCLRSGYPTVITVHGIQSEDALHQPSFALRLRKGLYARLIERYNLSHTRHLIAIGRYVTEYFRKVLHSSATVYDIPNAVAESFFALAPPGGGQTVLYAGRIIVRKRVLDLVAAFASIAHDLPAATLRLAGDLRSEPAYVEQVRDLVRTSGLTERVTLLGQLDEPRMLEEFARADILALASAQETTPMVIAQAMAAGRAIVATDVGGVREMVIDGETGWVVPSGDVGAFSTALRRSLTETALRDQFGAAGRRRALAEYHVRRVADRTHAVY